MGSVVDQRSVILDSNVVENVIRITMDVTVLVDVPHASDMREPTLGRRDGRNGISITIDDESMRKSPVKLPSDSVFEGARLTKSVQDEIISWDSILFVKAIDGDRGHGTSKRMAGDKDLPGLFLYLLLFTVCPSPLLQLHLGDERRVADLLQPKCSNQVFPDGLESVVKALVKALFVLSVYVSADIVERLRSSEGHDNMVILLHNKADIVTVLERLEVPVSPSLHHEGDHAALEIVDIVVDYLGELDHRKGRTQREPL